MGLARREFVRGPQDYLRLLHCVRVARRQATALGWGRGRTKRRVSLLSGVPRDPLVVYILFRCVSRLAAPALGERHWARRRWLPSCAAVRTSRSMRIQHQPYMSRKVKARIGPACD